MKNGKVSSFKLVNSMQVTNKKRKDNIWLQDW